MSIFRIATTSLRIARPSAPRASLASFRAFSVSSRRANAPEIDLAKLKKSSVFKALAGNDEAIKATQKFVEVLREKGFDYKTPPTKLQMLRLAADSEFREAFSQMHAIFTSAGVDMTSPEVQTELMGVLNQAPPAVEKP
ncbi:hypothetical protein CYLTODRAFT_446595 [Cylindrobasidium torrendii FP15055 ss-10]|uniref:Uncharacterized protein n=1 Tax=Cylindrobasidium torrendii FP15055 ss-10 TaxID=1314674 RepID=A0A0D7AZS9_9AGAR|nr:hypothetical protein CYLTODRAFT_446595 [Cylindrobasidium torrendii FP15055 ss-10]